MIPKRDFIEAGKMLAVGEQVSINHTACPSGEDKRQRLFVKNTGSAILAYCHNCGDKGYHAVASRLERSRVPFSASADTKTVENKPLEEHGLVLLSDCKGKYREIEEWIPEIVKGSWSPRVNPKNGRLVLPIVNIVDGDNKVMGWQERKFYDASVDQSGMKYKTYKFQGCKSWCEAANSDSRKYLVITEDIMSMFCATLAAEICGIALMKTTASDELILHIAKNYKRVAVWLDPDEAGIEAARKLTERLSLFVPTINIFDVPGLSRIEEAKTQPEKALKVILDPTTGRVWKRLEEISQT